MLGTLAKMHAYEHAPRATFAALHPKKSAEVAYMKYDLRHGYAPRLTAVGAALLAMPIGFMIGKILSDRKNRKTDVRTYRYEGIDDAAAVYSTEGASPLDPAIH